MFGITKEKIVDLKLKLYDAWEITKGLIVLGLILSPMFLLIALFKYAETEDILLRAKYVEAESRSIGEISCGGLVHNEDKDFLISSLYVFGPGIYKVERASDQKVFYMPVNSCIIKFNKDE
jgi:hypothetical protein